jgi:hypothetical protein
MKTEPTINIQDEVSKIHAQYGITEMANYRIEKLFEKHVEQFSPKVKQLEWDDYDGVYFDSISAVGHYIVFDGDKFSEASYRFALSYNGNLVDYFESLDEAKAAAQADFERRVMECLD